MKTFTGLAIAAGLAATATALPAVYTEEYQGTPGSTVRYDKNDIPDPLGNTTIKNPIYRALSEFDYASLNLALYQEYIELDLFNYGLKRFSDAEFEEAGVTADYRSIIQYMANQETGHAQLVTNMLGPGAAKACTYNYTGAFNNVREYLDFNQKVTKFGEAGVWGFLGHMNSRDSATLMSQSIATETRQQLLAPWIESCPAENPPVEWSLFPELKVDNNPSLVRAGSKAAVNTNTTALINPGDTIYFSWEEPGKHVGPNNSYTTVCSGKQPTHAIWVSNLNATLAELTLTGNNTAYAVLPGAPVYNTSLTDTGPAINGTNFVALVDSADYYTPYNLSLVVPHMVAGPAIFQSG
ncbi:hypothetical protein P389DRAFT_202165 [Cystobasidium minutum MCA 4210]|uniref:uncharacterized protein n=1 Tax=Cystobasidium minutum MCA 4210 TaxID=1397322 RepID=UPI0034CFBEB0|eukprot:jgi/Rhomi1/202165/MIX2994_750_52